jgi:cytochrome c oxidase assembly protein subunit 11
MAKSKSKGRAKPRGLKDRASPGAMRPAISRRMIWLSALVIVVMFSFGFVMSPLYDAICRAVGVSGKPMRVEAPGTKIDETRLVSVEFTGNTIAGLPWEFRPLTKKLALHPGEVVTISYYARNPSDEVIVAQAAPSITPALASEHFKKIECFCFTQQKLAPGEAREMPVRFYVDPALPREVNTITLSYGFFNLDKAQAQRFGGEAMAAVDHSAHAGMKH